MANNNFTSFLNMALIMSIITTISMLLLSIPVIAESSLQTYIVHVNSAKARVSANSDELKSLYESFLPKTAAGEEGLTPNRLVHSYRNVASGFAAKLSEKEVEEMSKIDGFIRATPQKMLSLHTTHSPNFLGLYQNLGLWRGSNYGEGIIIGVLDTGITPGHLSFDDTDMPPPPAKWKGKCEFNGTMSCNNKLIGAANFVSDLPGPPTDDEGHGTHTSSTAAGTFVQGANVFGMANGTAVGMAPRAYVAMYKVCSVGGCADADILAAMDAAIDDGVDVLSLSLGGLSAAFYDDGIAIGAFAAIQKGIFVSCSAGNGGPSSSTLSNEAPWILTVGASTTDRRIIALASLGNGNEYWGESLFQPKDFKSEYLPLVYAGADGNQTAALCGPGSLDNLDIKGKIVLCLRGGGIARIAKGQTVKDGGGAAMILMNDEIDGFSTLADPHVLPATHVSFYVGDTIRSYINSTAAPTATLKFLGTVIGNTQAPMVSSFSSRGPSLASPGILKPDIIGPGVSILAAWPQSVDNITNEIAPFNMISGTSMSCPHLSGIAALLKSSHPDWSPAAIKSAIMTTATQLNHVPQPIVDETNQRANMFAIGAGHVNPPSANDPGLIYDLQSEDYIPYLCGLGYTDAQIQSIVQQPVSCANITSIPEAQLNYPSFSVQLAGGSGKLYSRKVTNVGEANSSYYATTVYYTTKLVVIAFVEPDVLSFSQVNQKMTYNVTFQKVANTSEKYVEGAVLWRSTNHTVRTPFSINLVD